MAREVTEDYGNERRRFSVFTGSLRNIEPGESVAVGISILDATHVVTAEKTGYGQVFVQVHDVDWQPILAEEYDVSDDGVDVRTAVATAIADATERFLRIRTERFSQVDVETLPEPSN